MSDLNFPLVNVAQLFREQCQLFPNHVAIHYKNEQINYLQLDWLSNQLALYLIESGVKTSDLIGVYLDRSIIMVAGLLAILKVGAAYLPLDRKYPKDRLKYLISDSKISKLITLSDFSNEFKEALIFPILLDSFWTADIAIQETDFDIVNVDVNSIAYVNYTSGSTGHPKGVIIPHRGIISLVSKQKALKLDSSTVTLQLAPISFDALTFELWGPLLNGGCCVLFPYPLPMVHWLRETIRQYGVNAAFITSSLFNVLVDEEPDVFSSMDYVLVGGGGFICKTHTQSLSCIT